MRKLFLSIFLISSALPLAAEAIKLKNGVIVNGSIVGQTEYVLNVKTSYGTISLNQREIESILPDLHRVLLKGGGEFVGTVLDLDEFNLSLRTDSGVVNIDVNNIASMEIYDYDEAEKQKKYIEQKIAAETQAAAALEHREQGATAAEAAEGSAAAATIAEAGSSIKSSGGLTFDDDLEKIFPSKPAVVKPVEVFNYRTHDAQSQQKQDEEQAKEQALKEEEDSRFVDLEEKEAPVEQAKIKKTAKNIFAVQAGALFSGIKADLSKIGGPTDFDISGANMAIGLDYKRRLSERWWLGGSLAFGMLPKKTDTFADTITGKNRNYEASGQMYQIDALLTFYINPQQLTRLYLLGGGGYSSLSVDINEKADSNPKTQTYSSSSLAAVGGIGIERSIQDINIGLEVRGVFGSYGKELKESRSANVLATIKVSWFF